MSNRKQMLGYECRLTKDGRLGISPWSTCPDETRQWFTANRERIVAELKGKPVKVGTRLTRVIERSVPKSLLSVVPKASCGCKDYSKKMDQWGLFGCFAREEEILDHLVEQSKMMTYVQIVPKAMRRKVAKRMLDIASYRR